MQRLFDFDIPALSLSDALDRYTVITGRPTLYPSKLVEGRTASAVQGRYDIGAGLRLLLQGTGLGAEEVRDGVTELFVLKPAAAGAASSFASSLSQTATIAAPPSFDSYDALVQARVRDAFCASEATAPGSYRALLRFDIDDAGTVRRPRLMSGTGDARRDALLTAALDRLEIGRTPPPGLAQPFTLLILPRDQVAGRSCAAGEP
ncbi:MAG: Ferric-pseudobactin BN7/BN8 receptor [Herbaspirillum frisingense]|uniref:Ferric-pseudobactin BN7/BN8 receptor n=1 Tax=Herbaspirillum frisingense TaxID=92645 RepID=A0A7V8FXJ4_9BURK|nr:MAG: Ferric-pseudobactin BN7/BN8 receptor [Herbaspirillum frisingense]